MKKFSKLLVLILSFVIFFAGNVGAQKKSHKPLNLVFNDQIYKLNFNVNKNIISHIPIHYLIIGDKKILLDLDKNIPKESDLVKIETTFTEEISPEYLKKFFAEISGLSSEESNSVEIKRGNDNKIEFTGTPRSTYDIDFKEFYHLVNQAFLQNVRYVRIPAKKKFSNVIVNDKELKKKGIKEIIAIGESNFAGSSWARRKNISVAANLYNGIIVPKGRVFSFNDILQDVSKERGFVEELVIKGNKTEKEYGGGICQVSTTVFRAAFFGGLEIDKRRSHSYAVPYYKPQGLDATIYLDVQDFKFRNDTDGDILIQTIIEGDIMRFVFYGTKDERSVKIEGPFISDYKKAPEPIVEKTDQLEPGERYLKSYAHDGFFARWKRKITRPNSEPEEYILNSSYKAWPARILQGIEPEKKTKINPKQKKLVFAEF